MASRYRSLILLGIVLLAQLLLLAFQLRRDRDIPLIRYTTVLVVTPVQKGLRAVVEAAQGVWQGYVDLRGARQQSETLARQVDQLQMENHRLREEAEQGRRLQVLLDLRQPLSTPTVAARVISVSSSETGRMVTIDRGRDAGLQPDLPVLVPDGVVGKVLHVFPQAAQVLLLTDPYSGVACLLENSRVHGVLKGQNKPLGSLAYVPNGEPVERGQQVLTSGEDQIYPKGLPVGVVVEARPGPEFQQITVRPFAPLNRLEEVLVILKGPAQEPARPMVSAGEIPPAEAKGQPPAEQRGSPPAPAALPPVVPSRVTQSPVAQLPVAPPAAASLPPPVESSPTTSSPPSESPAEAPPAAPSP